MSAHPRHDARFYAIGPPLTVGDLAAELKAELTAPDLAGRVITGVAPVEIAGDADLTFVAGRRVEAKMRATRAGCCLVADAPNETIGNHTAWLVVRDPRRAFAEAVASFVSDHPTAGGVHPRAIVDDEAILGPGVSVGAGAVIEAGATIGAETVIAAGAAIERGVVLGEGCIIGANAVISHAIVGARVRIGANAAIGGPGFGFAGGPEGHLRMPQIGRVRIGDDVEIGSCTTVDRGAIGDTVIEDGVKIDNLVQVAHNCRIGAHAILVGQVGLSGSCDVGSFAVLGGQAGVADHVTIGEGAQVGARSGVMRRVEPGSKVLGAPAKPAYAFFREVAALQRLAKADKAKDRKA